MNKAGCPVCGNLDIGIDCGHDHSLIPKRGGKPAIDQLKVGNTSIIDQINKLQAELNALRRLVEAHSQQLSILDHRTIGSIRLGGGFFDE